MMTMNRNNLYVTLFAMACFRQAVVGFLPSLRKIPDRNIRNIHTILSPAKRITNNVTPPEEPRRQKRVNTRVRNIMKLIEWTYGKGDDWTKTKNYIYQASELSLEQVKEVITFLDSLVSKSVSKHILQTTPRILSKPVRSFLRPTADFLLDLWGPSLFEEAMNRNPRLLLSSGVGYTTNRRSSASTTASSQDGDIEKLLIERTSLSSRAVAKLKRTAPYIFGLPPTKVESLLGFLSDLLQHGNSSHKPIPRIVGKLVSSYPFLLNLSAENNLQPRIDFLSTRCGLNVTDVAKLVQSKGGGSILGLSVDKNLKPTVDFLTKLLDNDPVALRKCVLAHPQLLALSISNLQSKVDYFDSLGPSMATRIAFRCPAVFSLSLNENIIPTIDFLSKVWGVVPTDGQLTSITLANYLQEYPNILTLSLVGNIQTTMNFFNRTGYTVLDSDWNLMPGQQRIRGRYIAASLVSVLP